MKIISTEFPLRIHSFIISAARPCRNTLTEPNQRHEQSLKEKKKKCTEVSFTNWKRINESLIKLLEASLGTGLRHTVLFHHKTLKMGHCLWHELSSLATLHLTRSKTKKAFSPNKKHMVSHSITAIFSPAHI